MFKRLALTLTFCLFASAAWAQNPTCPTRPVGDSSNACASTAFVINQFSFAWNLLTNHALVLGAGAGNPPTALGSLGTTTTVLHGAASGPPTWGAINLATDITGVLPYANGGFPVPATAGDLPYWNGSAWVILPGNNSGTQSLQENGSGVPSWGTGNTCPAGVFCVSNYASPAAAITAINASSGGTLFFSQSATFATTQTISSGITVQCSNQSVVLGTSSTTVDMFDVTGNNVIIKDCSIGYVGGPAKTAGYLINASGTNVTIDNVHVLGYCFICFNMTGAYDVVSNTLFDGNLIAAPSGQSGLIRTTASELHLSNISSGASSSSDNYYYGIKIVSGAIDATNMQLLSDGIAVWDVPNSGNTTFAKITNSYLDSCVNYCLLIQPNAGGTIGYSEFTSMEFGTAGNFGIDIDQASGSTGNIEEIKINGGEVFQYTSGGDCIQLLGSLGYVQINNSNIGQSCVYGIVIQSGVTGVIDISDNVFSGGSTDGLLIIPTLTSMLVTNNMMNGYTLNKGSNSTTNVYGNLP